MVGWVERPASDGIRIRLVSTEAGRTARVLLEELLDVVLSHNYPPAVRLTASALGSNVRSATSIAP
jgi:hypothetical protein